MTWLELKIPPPVVALLCAIGMVGLPDTFGLEAFAVPFKAWVAGLVIAFGLSFDLLGLLEFRRHSTTVNPLSPNKSSQVVSSGIYRYTRNPMYLGMAIVLVGVAIWSGSPLGLLMVLAFALYITRFQIEPEERILEAKFGAVFLDYKSTVRRWIWVLDLGAGAALPIWLGTSTLSTRGVPLRDPILGLLVGLDQAAVGESLISTASLQPHTR